MFFAIARGKRRQRDANWQRAFTQDVSQTGIKMWVDHPAPEIDKALHVQVVLDVEIYLPAIFRSKPLLGRGEVVWRSEQELGVAVGIDLIKLSEAQRRMLKRIAGTLRDVTDHILGSGDVSNPSASSGG